jgi:hypothetical protein
VDGYGEMTLWDVAAWAFGPARPYRINTLYRLDGAVVTVTGRFQTPEAAAELAAALHVFEPLAAPVYLDLCHASLDERAAQVVTDAARRRVDGQRTPLIVRNAEPGTRARLRGVERRARRAQPVRPVVATPCVK